MLFEPSFMKGFRTTYVLRSQNYHLNKSQGISVTVKSQKPKKCKKSLDIKEGNKFLYCACGPPKSKISPSPQKSHATIQKIGH